MTNQANSHLVTTVAANIREAREAKGWTQRQLAHALHVDSMYVSRWERAKNLPAHHNLVALAEALGRQTEWFYADHGSGVAA